jgi:hypothetical protein
MRIRLAAVLGLTLVVAAGGCGRAEQDTGVATAGKTAKPSSSASAASKGDPVEFAKCMRENGVPDYPDPQTDQNGGMMIKPPDGADPAKVQAAMEKCKQYLPNGGVPPKADAQQLEQQRKFAKCMREQGITNFPDPDANGGIMISKESGIDPNSDAFKAANQACQKYQLAPTMRATP